MHIHISNVVAYLVSNIFNYIIILHYIYIYNVASFLCITLLYALLYILQNFYLPY